MSRPRTTDEVFTDELVTLLLLAEGMRIGAPPVDRLRLQKLCFLLEYQWFANRRKGLNYRFYRYRYGPFTPELYQTEVDLAVAGLIEDHGAWTLVPTAEGRQFADALHEDLAREPGNRPFLAGISDIIRETGMLSTSALLTRVYALETVPLGWREAWPLRDVPIGLDLTRPLEFEEATTALIIPQGWLETLALLVDERAEGEVMLPNGV